jgi:hypothetical protein
VLAQNQRRQKMTRVMTVLHYLMLPPTYLLFLPALWLARQLGLTINLLQSMGRVMRSTMLKGFVGYEPRPQDVFVCSYYKSGTNWTMQIAHQIATRGQGEFEHVHDVIAWPDSMPGYAIALKDAPIAAATDLRVIKTHLSFSHIPYSPQARYIAVVRNPKDAYVSAYHFSRDTMFGPMMFSVPDFLAYFLDDSFIFEPWGHFTHSYWQQRHQPNVLFMTYEEMKKDLPGTVQRVADFMGVELSQAEFALVCEKSSFAYMKAIDHKFYPGRIMPWSSPNGKMMRQGKMGNSSELLTPEQQQSIEDHFRAKLQQMGSDFPYDEWLATH